MKKIMKKIAIALAITPVMALSLGVFAPQPAVHAADCTDPAATGLDVVTGDDSCVQGKGQRSDLFGEGGIVTNIINIMLFIVGVLAVIMLIYGGIRYVTSGGAQQNVTAAKNTIMYAIIGLIVAILGYALVNWVTTSLSKD